MQLRTLTLLCLVSLDLCAIDYMWTNMSGNFVWANAANWNPSTGYPGSGSTIDHAIFTGSFTGIPAPFLPSGGGTIGALTWNVIGSSGLGPFQEDWTGVSPFRITGGILAPPAGTVSLGTSADLTFQVGNLIVEGNGTYTGKVNIRGPQSGTTSGIPVGLQLKASAIDSSARLVGGFGVLTLVGSDTYNNDIGNFSAYAFPLIFVSVPTGGSPTLAGDIPVATSPNIDLLIYNPATLTLNGSDLSGLRILGVLRTDLPLNSVTLGPSAGRLSSPTICSFASAAIDGVFPSGSGPRTARFTFDTSIYTQMDPLQVANFQYSLTGNTQNLTFAFESTSWPVYINTPIISTPSNATLLKFVQIDGLQPIALRSNSSTYAGGTIVNGILLLLENGTLGTGTLTVNDGGTIQAGATFALSYSPILAGTTATFDVQTFTFQLNTGFSTSGPAQLTIDGSSGTFQMLGTAGHTGGYNLVGATFSVSDVSQFGSGPLSFSGGTLSATAALNMSTPITLSSTGTINATSTLSSSGGISGSGNLTIGTGSITFAGSNNYTGTITVNGGAILLPGAENSLSSGATSHTINGTLNLQNLSQTITALNGSGTVNLGSGTLTLASGTFSGVISGSGGVTKQGAGTFTLSASGNNYVGTTSITNGTFSAGAANALSSSSIVDIGADGTLSLGANDNTSGGLSGSGTLSMGGGTTLTITGNASTTFSGSSSTGTISYEGSGLLNLTSSGTLTLTALNVLSGSVAANGSAPGVIAPITVSTTGTLKGSGFITGNVAINSGGKISPGNSIGTITITGALALGAGSTTVIELDPTTTSLISVTGMTSINPSANLQITVNPGLYAEGTTYTILTSGGGVVGTFASPILFTGTSLPFSISYPGNAVVLQLLAPAGAVPTTDLTGNSLVIADYINDLPDSYLAIIAPILGPLSGAELDKALMMISPSRNSFSTYSAQTAAFSVNQILSTRMSDRRMLPTCIPSCSLCEDEPRKSFLDSFRAKKNLPCDCDCGPLYAVWIDEFGAWSTQEAQSENPAFRFFNGGTLIGLDIGTQEQNVAGLVTGFLSTTIDEYAGYGRQDLTGYLLGGFGTGTWRDFYFEGALWAAYYNVGTWRQMTFTGFNQTASDRFSSWQLIPHAELGCEFGWTGMNLEPYFSLDWPIYFQPSYTEHGGEIFNLHIESHTSSFAQFQLGINAIETWEFTCFSLLFRQNVGWAHRAVFNTGTVRANMLGITDTFLVKSFESSQDVGIAGIELFIKAYNRAFFNLEVSGEGGSGYANIQCSGMIGSEF